MKGRYQKLSSDQYFLISLVSQTFFLMQTILLFLTTSETIQMASPACQVILFILVFKYFLYLKNIKQWEFSYQIIDPGHYFNTIHLFLCDNLRTHPDCLFFIWLFVRVILSLGFLKLFSLFRTLDFHKSRTLTFSLILLVFNSLINPIQTPVYQDKYIFKHFLVPHFEVSKCLELLIMTSQPVGGGGGGA